MSIYEAAQTYKQQGTPLIVIAGKEYGTGSSRDWAAKGPLLLGVRAVIAESFERIHRSNLVGMGILPMVFQEGQNAEALGLTGEEIYSITGLHELTPKGHCQVRAQAPNGDVTEFEVTVRVDTAAELERVSNGRNIARSLTGKEALFKLRESAQSGDNAPYLQRTGVFRKDSRTKFVAMSG